MGAGIFLFANDRLQMPPGKPSGWPRVELQYFVLERDRAKRLSFALRGKLHSFMKPSGQHAPVFGITRIVFTSSHVPTAATGVDLKRARSFPIPHCSRKAG